MDSFFFLIGVMILGLIGYFFSRKEEKENNALAETLTEAMNATQYRTNYNKLYVNKQHHLAPRLFEYQKNTINYTKYTQEQTHIGAVTVGGVTTGGTYKTGGYSSTSGAGENYKLIYRYVSDGKIVRTEIEKIELSSNLAQLAKSSPVKEYMEGNILHVVDQEVLNKGAIYSNMTSDRGVSATRYSVCDDLAHPNLEKCKTIMNFLSGIQ